MAFSPHNEVVFVYSASSGAPLAGQAGSMSFSEFVQDDGTILTPPTVTQVAPGVYSFPVSPAAGHGVAYILNTGTGAAPQYYARYVRPEDFYTDNISSLLQVAQGNWAIVSNVLYIYQQDGVTPLYRFNLKDLSGNPASSNVASRTAF